MGFEEMIERTRNPTLYLWSVASDVQEAKDDQEKAKAWTALQNLVRQPLFREALQKDPQLCGAIGIAVADIDHEKIPYYQNYFADAIRMQGFDAYWKVVTDVRNKREGQLPLIPGISQLTNPTTESVYQYVINVLMKDRTPGVTEAKLKDFFAYQTVSWFLRTFDRHGTLIRIPIIRAYFGKPLEDVDPQVLADFVMDIGMDGMLGLTDRVKNARIYSQRIFDRIRQVGGIGSAPEKVGGKPWRQTVHQAEVAELLKDYLILSTNPEEKILRIGEAYPAKESDLLFDFLAQYVSNGGKELKADATTLYDFGKEAETVESMVLACAVMNLAIAKCHAERDKKGEASARRKLEAWKIELERMGQGHAVDRVIALSHEALALREYEDLILYIQRNPHRFMMNHATIGTSSRRGGSSQQGDVSESTQEGQDPDLDKDAKNADREAEEAWERRNHPEYWEEGIRLRVSELTAKQRREFEIFARGVDYGFLSRFYNETRSLKIFCERGRGSRQENPLLEGIFYELADMKQRANLDDTDMADDSVWGRKAEYANYLKNEGKRYLYDIAFRYGKYIALGGTTPLDIRGIRQASGQKTSDTDANELTPNQLQEAAQDQTATPSNTPVAEFQGRNRIPQYFDLSSLMVISFPSHWSETFREHVKFHQEFLKLCFIHTKDELYALGEKLLELHKDPQIVIPILLAAKKRGSAEAGVRLQNLPGPYRNVKIDVRENDPVGLLALVGNSEVEQFIRKVQHCIEYPDIVTSTDFIPIPPSPQNKKPWDFERIRSFRKAHEYLATVYIGFGGGDFEKVAQGTFNRVMQWRAEDGYLKHRRAVDRDSYFFLLIAQVVAKGEIKAKIDKEIRDLEVKYGVQFLNTKSKAIECRRFLEQESDRAFFKEKLGYLDVFTDAQVIAKYLRDRNYLASPKDFSKSCTDLVRKMDQKNLSREDRIRIAHVLLQDVLPVPLTKKQIDALMSNVRDFTPIPLNERQIDFRDVPQGQFHKKNDALKKFFFTEKNVGPHAKLIRQILIYARIV